MQVPSPTIPAPARLIGADGTPVFGRFATPVPDVSTAGLDARDPMGRRLGRLRRHFRHNRFQYFGVLADGIVAGCALADVRAVALAFVYVYDPASGELREWTYRLPLALGAHLCDSPTEGVSTFRAPGCRIEMGTRDGAETFVRLDVTGLTIDASFSWTDPPFEPLQLCTRAGYDGWVYAQKACAVPARGTVRSGFGTVDLAEAGAFAHHDFSTGYMRHETFWNWACISADVGGRRFGLNLSCGVNETSWSENCIWVDGAVVPVGLARFEFDRADPMGKWHLSTADGAVDLDFMPVGLHAERLDVVVMRSNFKQVFGRFTGEVAVPGTDERLHLDGQYGICEDQYAKW